MPDESSSSTYTAFWLYRLDPQWRRLPADEQAEGKQEFLTALEKRSPEVVLRGAYSLVGMRNDADLLLWVHGPNFDNIQRLAVELNHTGLGAYLSSAYIFLGVVGKARYDPEHRPSFLRGFAPQKYLSMYPFVKTSDWYLLPYERRRELMAVHGRLGRRYTVPRPTADSTEREAAGGTRTAVATPATAEAPAGGGILTNTVDAFGLGDYEFIVAFEATDPSALAKMVEELRTAEVRSYTKLDTPIFLGRLGEPADVLEDL